MPSYNWQLLCQGGLWLLKIEMDSRDRLSLSLRMGGTETLQKILNFTLLTHSSAASAQHDKYFLSMETVGKTTFEKVNWQKCNQIFLEVSMSVT